MTDYPQRPDLPLTPRRKALLVAGAAMFVVQVAAALALAPVVTGEGDANAAAIAALWAASIPWSVVAALCIVRQADLPDIATASMLVTIAPYAAFTLMAAYEARDEGRDEPRGRDVPRRHRRRADGDDRVGRGDGGGAAAAAAEHARSVAVTSAGRRCSGTARRSQACAPRRPMARSTGE